MIYTTLWQFNRVLWWDLIDFGELRNVALLRGSVGPGRRHSARMKRMSDVFNVAI